RALRREAKPSHLAARGSPSADVSAELCVSPGGQPGLHRSLDRECGPSSAGGVLRSIPPQSLRGVAALVWSMRKSPSTPPAIDRALIDIPVPCPASPSDREKDR